MNKTDAYLNWATFDPSRKDVLQQEAFAAGWKAAMSRAMHVVKFSYIVDEGEDITEVITKTLEGEV